jgi:hypothetical protein
MNTKISSVGSPQDQSVLLDKNATVHGVTIAGSADRGSMSVVVPENRLLLATDRIVVESGGRLDLQRGNVVSSAVELRGGTLTGAGTMTTPVVAEQGTINVPNLTQDLTLNGSVTITASGLLHKNGPGQLNLRGPVSGGTFFASQGITESSAVKLGSLAIGESQSTFRLRPSSGTSVINILTILDNNGPTGKLDISNNAAILDYSGSSPTEAVRQQILNGRGGAGFGATWEGSGITSSIAALANQVSAEARAIGYAENASLALGPYTAFRGEPVDDSALLIAYTRTGDANLDGVVNDDDVTIVGATYAPGVPKPAWALGDFDYNGFVDDDDVTLLGAFYDPNAAPLSIADIVAASTPGRGSVPEPCTLALVVVAALSSVALVKLRPRIAASGTSR